MKDDLKNKVKLCNRNNTKLQDKFNVINFLPERNDKKKKQIEKELFDIFKKYS